MKTLLIIFALIAVTINPMSAQQDPMFTQYMFNTLAINPAYAGSRQALNISALYRNQWGNINGAPVTQTFFAHSPVPYTNSSVGLSVLNDEIGPSKQSIIYGDYAYTIQFKKFNLAMGLKGGANIIRTDKNSLDSRTEGDPAIEAIPNTKFDPDFGAGLYVYSTHWYTGFSVPKMIQNEMVSYSELKSANEKRHYFLIGGAMVPIFENLQFKPTAFLKATEGAPLQGDFTASLLFYERILAGAMVRTEESWGLLLMAEVMRGLRVGYSYDKPSAGVSELSNGSHELMISYDFVFNPDRIKSPRYF